MKIDIKVSQPVDEIFFKQLARQDVRYKFPFLPSEQCEVIADMQYIAKLKSYNSQYPNALTYLVVDDDKPMGKIALNDNNESVHIIDVVVSEEFRNLGIGRKLLALVELNALQKGIANIALLVAINNPAINLYRRSGFNEVDKNDTHIKMIKELHL